MNFWDSSAIFPLLIPEERTDLVKKILIQDPHIIVWTLTSIECYSAFFRLVRENHFSLDHLNNFRIRLKQLSKIWSEVDHLEFVKVRSERLLASHPLKAADSLQLAAALVLCEDRPERVSFVSLDHQLCTAALKEGFHVHKI